MSSKGLPSLVFQVAHFLKINFEDLRRLAPPPTAATRFSDLRAPEAQMRPRLPGHSSCRSAGDALNCYWKQYRYIYVPSQFPISGSIYARSYAGKGCYFCAICAIERQVEREVAEESRFQKVLLFSEKTTEMPLPPCYFFITLFCWLSS